MSKKKINFVTGKLAEPALVSLLKKSGLGPYDIITLPAQVAALMTTKWIARRLPDNVDGDIMIPGGCKGAVGEIGKVVSGKVSKGPLDLHDIPRHFGMEAQAFEYAPPRMKIIAEIVDAHAMTIPQIVRKAKRYTKDGADWIDVGCSNDTEFGHLKETIEELVRLGYKVSLDSFNQKEMITASRAGARMFLSVNSTNIDVAPKLNGDVVVIPDFGKGNASLYKNMRTLEEMGVAYIADPVLDPIGFGAAESIARYVRLRQKFPDARIMAGIGNIMELTSADNVGLNAMLAGLCAELKTDFVLTTEVIGWNADSVRQLAIARQIMERAVTEHILPKHYDDRLLVLRDASARPFTTAELKTMSKSIKDRNYRVFVSGGVIHIFNRDIYLKETSVDEIFEKLEVDDPSHAYYLGKELMKANIALQLGKNYAQDQPLGWGYISERIKPGRKR